MPSAPRALVPLAMFVAVVAASTASIFIRWAQPHAPSLAIAAGRLLLASAVLSPLAWARHAAELRALSRRDAWTALAAGAFLAAHFGTWIASLEHTSVVSSVVLVTTSPLWVALLSPLVLRERLAGGTWLGIAVALAGAAVLALGDATRRPGAHPHALAGDLLALAGAWAMAGYLLIGRRLRTRLSLVPYAALVYGAAAVLLLVVSIAAGQGPASIGPPAWPWVVLLALLPQLVGHSALNWSLRHVPAAVAAVVLLGEPIGSALLAFALLGEAPSRAALAGGALILIGIALVARGPTSDGASGPRDPSRRSAPSRAPGAGAG
jgi:drug/metabolite transporter (DMT)-like permease